MINTTLLLLRGSMTIFLKNWTNEQTIRTNNFRRRWKIHLRKFPIQGCLHHLREIQGQGKILLCIKRVQTHQHVITATNTYQKDCWKRIKKENQRTTITKITRKTQLFQNEKSQRKRSAQEEKGGKIYFFLLKETKYTTNYLSQKHQTKSMTVKCILQILLPRHVW